MRLIVNTKHGPVEGFAREGIRRWFGIPFAAPPVGALRFRRARDPESWTEVRPCTRMGCAPIQFAAGPMAETMVVSAPVSEDCLYLNVWAPEQAEKVPVFVYIYGGANHMGEASAPDHDLSAFAREGMVGVSFNYRLGPLGFYNFSRLGPDFDSNCAVSDMIQALKWVHENIAAFGGDPENVTICGESAGGTGVYSLLAAPAARGYFQKAIPMSGLAGNVTTQYIHDLNNALFFDELGLDPGSAAKLKTMPVSELIRGAGAVMARHNEAHQGIFLTGPVMDDLVPDYPWRMLEKGNAAGVKLLVGTCKNEGGLFYMMGLVPRTWADIESCLTFNGRPELTGRFRAVYGAMEEKDAAQAWDTDRMFWVDAMRCALAQSRHNDVYVYRFDFEPVLCRQLGIGATHSLDIGPGLDTWSEAETSFYKDTPREQVEEIHRKLHGAFAAFARTGDPNGSTGLTWEPFTAENRTAMTIDTQSALLRDPNRDRFDVWGDLILFDK